LAVVGGEEQPLRPALGAGEPPALERRERRGGRLEPRDVRRPGLRDRKGTDRIVELTTPRLHLRKLRHYYAPAAMAEPITVAVRAGSTVESRHRIHAVAVQ